MKSKHLELNGQQHKNLSLLTNLAATGFLLLATKSNLLSFKRCIGLFFNVCSCAIVGAR